MGVLSTSDEVSKVYYNSKRIKDQEAIGYLKASHGELLLIDTQMQEIPELHWHEILENLDVTINELVDLQHDIFQTQEDINSFSLEDWVTIIKKNPSVVQGTVVIRGDEYLHFKSPENIIEFIADRPDSSHQNRC